MVELKEELLDYITNLSELTLKEAEAALSGEMQQDYLIRINGIEKWSPDGIVAKMRGANFVEVESYKNKDDIVRFEPKSTKDLAICNDTIQDFTDLLGRYVDPVEYCHLHISGKFHEILKDHICKLKNKHTFTITKFDADKGVCTVEATKEENILERTKKSTLRLPF